MDTIKAHGYSVQIMPLRLSDGGGFAAFVPDLPGCMSDGATREEAVRHVEDAIGEWIAEATRLGHELPAPTHSKTYA